MRKKLTVLLFSVFLVSQMLSFPALANAQETWWAPSYEEFNRKVSDENIPPNEIFGERYTHAQVYWIVYTILNFATDPQIQRCVASNPFNVGGITTCLNIPPKAEGPSQPFVFDGRLPGGILTFAALSDYMVANKPASGVSYVARAIDKLGIPTAMAQEGGFGFNTLSPILPIWTASRNAAYGLMILAVILLAFMIMFRTKISAQASVSVQSAIPRVIIGLILITFSYAIAGFIIDMAYVIMGVIAAIFSNASGIMNSPYQLSAIDIFNRINDVGGSLLNMALTIILLMLVPTLLLGTVVGAIVGVLGGPIGAASGAIVGSIILVILVIIILVVAVIRIFWLFLRTYVTIIFQVLALPFAALGYVASPSGNLFMQLLKSMVAHVSVFVSLTLTIMLAQVIFWGFGAAMLLNQTSLNVYNVRVFVTENNILGFPGLTTAEPALLGVFLGIIVLLMAPSVATGIREFISTGRYRASEGMLGAGILAGTYALARGGVERGVVGGLGLGAATRLQDGYDYGNSIFGKLRKTWDTSIASTAITRGHLNAPRPDKYSITGQVGPAEKPSSGASKGTRG